MIGRRAAGSLESEILAVLWAADEPLRAEEVRRRLGSDLAHTTVNTILGRLHEKGAVERHTGGRSYRYRPVLDQAGLTARRMQALLDGGPDRTGVLSRFVDGLDRRTLQALRRLLDDDADAGDAASLRSRHGGHDRRDGHDGHGRRDVHDGHDRRDGHDRS